MMQIHDAVMLAQTELTKWGLAAEGWTVKINPRLSRALGRCCYAPKQIELNPEYVQINGQEVVMDTILHEIAHALTPGAKHGRAWKQACLRVGAKPNRLADPAEKILPGKWQLVVVTEGVVSTHIERTNTFTNRKRRLHGCQLRGRPETLNKLQWLPVENR